MVNRGANDRGGFLRSRRERLTPDAAGIEPGTTHRRVPGLRREEPAELAGVISGALHSFALSAAIELPRGMRINVVSPTMVGDSADAFAEHFPGMRRCRRTNSSATLCTASKAMTPAASSVRMDDAYG